MTRIRWVKSYAWVVVVVLGTFWAVDPPAGAGRLDRDLPVMVSIRELLSEPDRFDGKRVVVSGRVASLELQKGRRGGNYILLRLEALESSPTGPPPTIKVFSLLPPRLKRGHEALVQGQFVHEGKSGGLPFDNFIRADAFMREP